MTAKKAQETLAPGAIKPFDFAWRCRTPHLWSDLGGNSARRISLQDSLFERRRQRLRDSNVD